jgi:hypothetical protein
MAGVIPEAVRRFLSANIDSIAQLEALLLLWRHPDQKLTAEAIAERLYISPVDAEALLNKLASRALIVADDSGPLVFQLNRKNEQLVHDVDRVAQAYAKYLIPITNFIHHKPSQGLRDFADAFKLKRDE